MAAAHPSPLSCHSVQHAHVLAVLLLSMWPCYQDAGFGIVFTSVYAMTISFAVAFTIAVVLNSAQLTWSWLRH